MFQRALSPLPGSEKGNIELSAVLSSKGCIIIDTQTVTSVKYKLVDRNSTSDALIINVSNSARQAGEDTPSYGTQVKTISTIMSDYEDLLSLPEVSGYRYINLYNSRTSPMTQVDLQIS